MVQGPVRGGALVLSLDFELHWGVSERVHPPDHPYTANLHGAREAVTELLRVFTERDVHATWATVGKLFAHGRIDLEAFLPETKPAYDNPNVDTYRIPVGESEEADPLHFAPSLIEQIQKAPGQEVACHTFAHYYCDEPGQTVDTFRADLDAAASIAARHGVQHRSLVFPRNQVAPVYVAELAPKGIDVYRGNPPNPLYSEQPKSRLARHAVRAVRLADSYVNLSGHHTVPWAEIDEGTIANVRASRFLRPYSRRLRALEPLRRRRVKAGLQAAAQRGEIFHLWWHPHNFGRQLSENLTALEDILDTFHRLREQYGMESLTMAEAADKARAAAQGSERTASQHKPNSAAKTEHRTT